MLNACNITKQLRSSQQLLYNGSTIKVTGETRNDIIAPIADNLKQKPNKRFLGITKLKLRMYYFGAKHPDSKFGNTLRDKYGELPVILDTAFIESSIKSMKSYLRGHGFYYPEITYTVKTRRQRAKVHYDINTNQVYHIATYTVNCADKSLYKLIKANEKDALIKKGNRLNQETLLEEQKRIVTLLRNNGYYTFSNEFVGFDVDTANNNWLVNISLNVLNKSMYEAHQIHYTKNVYVNIEPNYDISSFKNKDTIITPTFFYVSNRYKLNPQILDRNIFLKPSKRFNQLALNVTYNRLGDLSVFRFINIVPKSYTLNDTNFIDYQIRLSPDVKYNYIIEPQAILSDQNNTFTNQSSNAGNFGVAAILQFNNRNSFRNAELFKLTYRTSFEAQGRVSGTRWFNATEQSLTASLTFPRLLFLPKMDKGYRFVNTKTILTTSAIYELNTNFERQVFTTGFIYQLNKRYTSYYITPFEVSYTRNAVNSDTLRGLINKDIYLFSMFSNNLIIGSRFGFVYSDKLKKKRNYIYLRWDVLELSGNTATLLNKMLNTPLNETKTYNLLGVNYSQFAKTAFDFRYNKIIDENNATVFRVYTGIGIPYGNSPKYLPFERRFWVGGANSLRAWLPRSLGPGGYYRAGQVDYSGDIKLETNAEYRFNMYNRWLEGAVFVDAGNVWMSKKDETRPLANFEFNRFWKEFGVGTGFGTRLNFEIILIRLDFAIPLYDPSYNEGSRVVIYNFDRKWLYNNINFNFGIGYPF